MNPIDVERFWSKADRSGGRDACWLWVGSVRRGGYGRFHLDGSSVSAHRIAYEIVIGPIPDGLVIDHLCRIPACVNPAHLEPVTSRENVLRGKVSALRESDYCRNGHPVNAENSYMRDGRWRCCRACARRRRAEYRSRIAA